MMNKVGALNGSPFQLGGLQRQVYSGLSGAPDLIGGITGGFY